MNFSPFQAFLAQNIAAPIFAIFLGQLDLVYLGIAEKVHQRSKYLHSHIATPQVTQTIQDVTPGLENCRLHLQRWDMI